MDTKAWGPSAWKFLHIVSFNYPEKPTAADKRNYKTLFTNFKFTLPCKYCRESYELFLKDIPIDPYLASRQRLTMWLYLIHNKVNDKLRNQGNPVPPNPSFQEIKNHYEQFRAGCSKVTKSCTKDTGKTLSLADRLSSFSTYLI